MVIGNGYVGLPAIFPTEDDPPLLVDPDTPEAFEVAPESLRTFTRRDREILQRPSLIDHAQLPPDPVLDVAGKIWRALSFAYSFSLGVAETHHTTKLRQA